MAYDEKVAERLRRALARRRGLTEKKMFGGIAFLLDGNMCCGVIDREIVLRLGEAAATDALGERHTRPMDFTGKPLESMVYLQPAGYRSDEDLRAWVARAVEHVRSLPAKKKKKPAAEKGPARKKKAKARARR